MSGTSGVIMGQITPSSPPGRAGRRERAGFQFWLFIFLNVLVLIRPGELFPSLAELPGELYPPLAVLHLYEMTILACLAVSLPRLKAALSWKSLKERPIIGCVVGLLPLITWSVLWQGAGLAFLQRYALEYLKIVIYFLLLVSTVDSAAKLRKFVVSLALIITAIAGIALVDFWGLYRIKAIVHLVDHRGEEDLARIIGVGIFADPNDLAQWLGVGMVLCVYGCELARGWPGKLLWTLPMILMLTGIYLTQSRGGLLAMLAGLGILFVARFGVKKAALLGVVSLIPLLLLFGGHRTNISTDDDSARSRVQLWSDAIVGLRAHPFTGLGAGMMDEYAGQVAHNSFLQFYVEQGLPGGFLFFLSWYVAVWGVLRLRLKRITVVDEDLAKLTPVLAAAIICYGVGMLSLTRNYVIPTYLMLGLATAYMSIVRTAPEKEPICWSMRLVGRSFAASLLYLLAMQVFIKAFVRWN